MKKRSLILCAILAAMIIHVGTASRADDKPVNRFEKMPPAELRNAEEDIIAKAVAQTPRAQSLRTLADLALIPPKMDTAPSLEKYGYDKLDYAMTIGIERTPKGRLWACWVSGGDSPKAFFVLASSDDDGRTWSSPRLVLDSHSKKLPMDRSIIVGNLWTDPLGRLWLFFDQSMVPSTSPGTVTAAPTPRSSWPDSPKKISWRRNWSTLNRKTA